MPVQIFRSTGNVFCDLGHPEDDRKQLRASRAAKTAWMRACYASSLSPRIAAMTPLCTATKASEPIIL
jgi:hypothetical protein